MDDRRDEFLIEVYRQCSAHLDRHIMIPWQSVGVIGAAIAVFLLEGPLDKGKATSELDFVISVAVVLCVWLCANLYDANNWFDRNLHIIANIERQFLNLTDLIEIHPFFGQHRFERDGHQARLLRHFKIQFAMAVAIWVLVLAYHYSQRLYGMVDATLCSARSLPYFITGIGIAYVYWIRTRTSSDTARLFKASPGKKL
jgi:hypothetical protein